MRVLNTSTLGSPRLQRSAAPVLLTCERRARRSRSSGRTTAAWCAAQGKPGSSQADKTSGKPLHASFHASRPPPVALPAIADGNAPAGLLPRLLPPQPARQIAALAAGLLRRHFWQLFALFSLKEGLVWLLHRVSHRLTNEVWAAMMGYGVGAAALLPPGTSPWYLLMDADFLNGNGAYQAAMVVVFLLALPVTLLLNAACGAAAAVMVAAPYQQAGGMSGSSGAVQARPSLGPVAAGSGSKAGVLGALRSGVAAVASAAQHLAAVLPALPRLWRVEASVGVRTLLYMGLALALLPAPWALPRLLMMQLALPAAVLEGAGAGSSTPVADAVGRSRALLSRPGVLRSYGWLMLGPMALLAGLRQLQGLVFSSIPVRWWSQVVEVPVALMVAFSLATLLLSRFADVVPAATLLALRASEPGAVPGCLTAKRA